MASLLSKAIKTMTAPLLEPRPKKVEARGTLSGFALGVSPLWGQPYPEQMAEDASGLISRARMREVILRTPTAAACTNAILDFAGGVQIHVRNVNTSEVAPALRAKKIERILNHPNPNQTKRQFFQTLFRDLITFGYATLEIVHTGKIDKPVDLWVMDGARLRIDFDEHGLIRGYDMLNARGAPIIRPQDHMEAINSSNLYSMPQGNIMGVFSNPSIPSYTDTSGEYNAAIGNNLHGWAPEEVILFSLNPISESVYPHSRIVQLFTSAVLEDLMMQFISERFTDSNIPFGVYDLGDISEQELRIAIDNWNAQGKTGNRVLLTGSKGSGAKWVPFGYHLKDLEAVQLLQEFRMKIMGILGVTSQELGESQDVNKSNGYNLSFTFKKRAIEPLLDEVTQTLTQRLLWQELGYEDVELYYDELDHRDDFLQSQIYTNYMKLGILTPNQIRNRRGDISIPGGEEALINSQTGWIPLAMVREMAETDIQVAQGAQAIGEREEGESFREKVGPQLPTVAGGEPGGTTSNGHKPGSTATLARQITGNK